MCGRYRMSSVDAIARAFPRYRLVAAAMPRWNIAPTDDVLAVRNDGRDEIVALRWGLVPMWSDDPKIGSKLINARVETLTERPAFRDALRRRRALVLSDGFYEWQKGPNGRKVPMHVRLQTGEPFAFAGLWERWRRPHQPPIDSVTIITTNANALLEQIHDRMPVILDPKDYDRWLQPAELQPDAALPLLLSQSSDALVVSPASPRLNRVGYDAPDCLEPAPADLPLFGEA